MKKKIFSWLLLAVGFFIIAYLLQKISWVDVIATLGVSSFKLIFIITITAFLRHYFQYQNWRLFIASEDQQITKHTLTTYLIGLALRYTLPGGLGTLGKSLFFMNKKRALAACTCEKLLIGAINITVGGLILAFFYAYLGSYVRIMIILANVALVVPIIIYRFLPIHFKAYLQYLRCVATRIYTNQIFFLLILSIQYKFALAEFGGQCLGKTTFLAPLVTLVDLVPMSITGLGLREGFCLHLWETSGVTATAVVAASLLLYLCNDLIPGILGACALIRFKKLRIDNKSM